MPLYEYECEACGHRVERIQKFSDPPLEHCPKCGGAVHKLQAAPAFQFKGSGWYITDYARKDGKSGTGDSSKGPAGKADGSKSEGGKSEGGKSEGAKSEGAKDSGSSSGDKAAASSTTTTTKDSGSKSS